jgi:hypothetical protein
MYANIHDSIATTPDIPNWIADPGVKSVLLPKGKGFWMQTFSDENF